MGFRALEPNPSIYVRGNVIIRVYVDDILACSISISYNSFISELAQKIEVVNKGEVRSFLGISVTRNYPQHAIYWSAWIYRSFTCQIQHDERQICVYSLQKRHQAHIGDQERYALQPQNVPSLSITSLSSQDPISHLLSPNSSSLTPIPRIRTSKPRYTSYATLNSLAIIILSTDVHQPSRLPISSAIQMRTNSLSNSPCFSPHRKSNGARDSSDNPAKYRQAKHIDVRYHAVRHCCRIQIDYIPSKQPCNCHEAFKHCKTFSTTPSSCIIFVYYKRRFFSEYAALQRVSHHQSLVSIKDFSYLIHVHNVFSLLFLSSKNPGNVTQARRFRLYTHILYIARHPPTL